MSFQSYILWKNPEFMGNQLYTKVHSLLFKQIISCWWASQLCSFVGAVGCIRSCIMDPMTIWITLKGCDVCKDRENVWMANGYLRISKPLKNDIILYIRLSSFSGDRLTSCSRIINIGSKSYENQNELCVHFTYYFGNFYKRIHHKSLLAKWSDHSFVRIYVRYIIMQSASETTSIPFNTEMPDRN